MKRLLATIARMLEPNHGDHSKVSSLEGIRGFAVLTVFVAHYTILIDPWIDKAAFGRVAYGFLRFYGYFGVDMFFAVSGYLIYAGVIKLGFKWQDYARKRFLRIYPTFLAAIFLYVALCLVVPSQSKLPAGVWSSILFVAQNLIMLPGVIDIQPLISQAWSLSYEMFFYVSLPVIVWVLALRLWSSAVRIAVFGLLLAAYWGYCLWSGAAPSRFSALVLGLLAYELKPFVPGKSILGVVGLLSAVLTLPIAVFRMADMLSYVTTYVINCSLIFVAFIFGAFHRNLLSNLLSLRPVRWFGNMSYSYFLFHGLAIKFMLMILALMIQPSENNTGLYFVYAPICFVATLIISLAAYCYVEYPFSIARTVKSAHRMVDRPAV